MLTVFGQKGYCDPMHRAVLADFSRCLHVRKRKYSSPSDLSNGLRVRVRKIRAEMEEQRSATRRKTAVYAQQNYSLAQTRTGDSHSKPSWRGLESTPKCQSWLN